MPKIRLTITASYWQCWPRGQGVAALMVVEEQACKVSVHTLVVADVVVGESRAGYETTLLEPEDGCKGA